MKSYTASLQSTGVNCATVAATGTAPLAYQWRRNGTNIAGATGASYGATTDGSYTVVVSNTAGSVTSSAATVTVVVPPVITTQPASVTINQGQTTTLRVVATGTSPTYQWRRDGNSIAGATASSYTTGTPGSYSVVVSNAAGSVTSTAATVTVIVPPTITTQPVGATINQGQSTTLSVQVSGTSPTFRWQRNQSGGWTDIAGATSISYATGTAGSYRVVVSNAAGSVTSATATVTVR